MYQKLETRLMLYEKDHPIKDDHELVAAIESILDEQDSLPVEERDFDLIAEATNTILKLQGYDENHLDEMAYEAAASVRTRIADNRMGTSNGQHQSKRHHFLRWVIPLVAVLALTTVAVFASPTNRLAISDITRHIYASLKPKSVYHEDNIDLVVSKDTTVYTSLNDFSSSFNNILLPFDLESEFDELKIEVSDLGQSFYIKISFSYQNYDCFIIIIDPQQVSNSSLIYTSTIGGREVAINNDGEKILAEWIEDQIYYQIKAPSTDSLEKIIKNMRTLK